MYYESITHRSVPVADAAAAATLIRSGHAASFDALIWTNSSGQRIAAVADGGLDKPWFEVAVIALDADRQIESITFGWIRSDSQAIAALQAAENAPVHLHKSPAALPLDGAGEDDPTDFTCGCCGDVFESTIRQQRIWDQDEGYGIGPCCASYHQERVA